MSRFIEVVEKDTENKCSLSIYEIEAFGPLESLFTLIMLNSGRSIIASEPYDDFKVRVEEERKNERS